MHEERQERRRPPKADGRNQISKAVPNLSEQGAEPRTASVSVE